MAHYATFKPPPARSVGWGQRCPWRWIDIEAAEFGRHPQSTETFAPEFECSAESGSGPQEGFDGTAVVHGAVAVGHLLERQSEVEDLAEVDAAGQDAVDEIGQEAPDRGEAATQPDASSVNWSVARLRRLR